MRRFSFSLVIAALTLAGCSSSGGGSVAREWLPKLQEENAFVCRQDVCDTADRRAKLTQELADDAEEAGGDYEAVAALAARTHLAHKYWEQDCYPNGTRSKNAGMTCDEAFDLELHGTDQLEALLREVAQSEQ
jgi:hypothetical protein